MPGVKTVSELNKDKVCLFVEAVWNQGQLELVDELVAADYIGRISGAHSRILGPKGVRELVSTRRRAYPALYIKVQDQVAEEDQVVIRWRATTAPDTPSASASNGPVQCCEGISIVRLVAGKQVDSHTQYTNFVSAKTADSSDGLRPVPEASSPPNA